MVLPDRIRNRRYISTLIRISNPDRIYVGDQAVTSVEGGIFLHFSSSSVRPQRFWGSFRRIKIKIFQAFLVRGHAEYIKGLGASSIDLGGL